MTSALRLRSLTSADLAFADTVRAAAGWNQTLADWQRFLALEPDGCFLAEWDGTPAGTATTLIHGPELAWIGMVLVPPEMRRRGIGRALLLRCLDHLRGRGVACIKLDATPLGQPVYEALGFRSEWSLARWERPGTPAGAPEPFHEPTLTPALSRRTGEGAPANAGAGKSGRFMAPLGAARSVPTTHAPGPAGRGSAEPLRPRTTLGSTESRPTAWADLDAAAFGVARTRLCEVLLRQGAALRLAETTDREVAGFGLSRAGSRARYLGPVVAASPDEGLSLIEDLLGDLEGDAAFWDIPEPNAAAVSWAEAHGFRRQRSLTRMFYGENLHPGNPAMQFALAGPEVG